MTATLGKKATVEEQGSRRWVVLAANVVAMMAIANLQYGWTQFTTPLTSSLHTSLAAVQVSFTLFVLMQTWGQPVWAYMVDKLGARLMCTIGALLVGYSWVGAGMARSLVPLYIAYSTGGVGAGIVYGATVGMATKWFSDRRGLAVGLTSGAYGFGSAFTVIPIANMIKSYGTAHAFITFGIIQGVLVLAAAQFMRFPPAGWQPAGFARPGTNSRVAQTGRNFTPVEMMKTAPFYVLFLMMTMVAFGGMMMTAQMKPIAHTYGYDTMVFASGVTFLSISLINEQVANGVTRPFWGWVSDHIGRYNTMSIAFLLEGIGIILLGVFVENPVLFMIFSAMTFFAWGEIYSLFPSAIADLFGSRYSTTNYGILYTSKGVATILAAPGAAWLMGLTESWLPLIFTAAAFDLTVALLAYFWMRPMVTAMARQAEVHRNTSPLAG